MIHASTRLVAALGAAVVGLLAACASPTTEPASKATEQAQAEGADKDTVTGSRIPRKTSDRLLRKTDAKGAAEMARNLPPDPGPLNK